MESNILFAITFIMCVLVFLYYRDTLRKQVEDIEAEMKEDLEKSKEYLGDAEELISEMRKILGEAERIKQEPENFLSEIISKYCERKQRVKEAEQGLGKTS